MPKMLMSLKKTKRFTESGAKLFLALFTRSIKEKLQGAVSQDSFACIHIKLLVS
jgi:hypothetical protein